MTTKNNFFADLLTEVARRPVEQPIFDEAYEQVLKAVHTDGTFVFEGMVLDAPPGIYKPKRGSSTEFVVTHWDSAGLGNAHTLLEIGTGAGGLSLYALKRGCNVMAGDIDPLAVATAGRNAHRNGLSLDVRHSDLFQSFKGRKFDAILFNFPLYHKESATWDEHTLSDENGIIAKRFFDEAHDYLEDDGAIVFMYSNCSDGTLLSRPDWNFQIVGCDYFALGNYWRALVRATPVK